MTVCRIAETGFYQETEHSRQLNWREFQRISRGSPVKLTRPWSCDWTREVTRKILGGPRRQKQHTLVICCNRDCSPCLLGSCNSCVNYSQTPKQKKVTLSKAWSTTALKAKPVLLTMDQCCSQDASLNFLCWLKECKISSSVWRLELSYRVAQCSKLQAMLQH